jgi:Skp family chaperone for outer membrane proteins
MKTLLKGAALAALAIPAAAHAQATSIGVANLDQAVERSGAYTLAVSQIKTTYKAQIDAFDARSKVLNTEIQPLITAFQTAQRAPNANQQALQTQATQIQTRQQNAQRELQQLYLPIGRAQAYAEEQVVAKLDQALKAAMNAKRIGLVLQPQATVSYQPVADITNDIIGELNKLVPSVGIVPPANWQPGGQGQAPGAAPAVPVPGQPAAPQPPRPQPQGR